MPLQRISIKMNAWDYDYLYRVQETAILVGSKFNNAPSLNEIVRGLIRYVSIKIRESNQSAYEFRRSMDLFSEVPREVYERMKESAASIPSADGGSYIFMASEEDISIMDSIIKIVRPNDAGKEAPYPSIIRNAIRHVLGEKGFFSANKQKYDFVGLTVLSTLYGIGLDKMVQLVLDPSFNIRDLSMDSRNKINGMGKELVNLSKYVSTIFYKDERGDPGVRMNLYSNPEKYYDGRKEFVSLIGDFNYLDMHTGLVISAFAWEFDTSSVPYILNSIAVVGPIVSHDIKGKEKRGASKHRDDEMNDPLALYRYLYGFCAQWIIVDLLPMIKQISLRVS